MCCSAAGGCPGISQEGTGRGTGESPCEAPVWRVRVSEQVGMKPQHSCGGLTVEWHLVTQRDSMDSSHALTYSKKACHAVTPAGCRPDTGIRASAGTAPPRAPGQQRDAEDSSRTDAALHEALTRMSGDDLPASFDEGDGPTGGMATAGRSSHAASHAYAAFRQARPWVLWRTAACVRSADSWRSHLASHGTLTVGPQAGGTEARPACLQACEAML